MSEMLTVREKRHVQEFLEEAPPVDTSTWPEWASWMLFASGGVVLILTCLVAARNLGAANFESLFSLGIVLGSALLGIGVYQVRRFKKLEQRKLLRSAVRKLLAS